jgi:hypothetical protein
LDTAAAEALSPQANGLAIHGIIGRDGNFRLPSGDGQNDAAAQRHLLRCSQSQQPTLEFAAFTR